MAPLPEAYYGKRRYGRPKARQGRMSHHAEKLQTWYVGAPLVTPARRNGVKKTASLPKIPAVASVPPVVSLFPGDGRHRWRYYGADVPHGAYHKHYLNDEQIYLYGRKN